MNTDKHGLALGDITEKILQCAFRVHNKLGCGFLEKVYENALVYELRKNGLAVQQQFQIDVFYEDQRVGDYVGDLLIEGQVIVELKVCQAIDDVHAAICLNYLRATRKRVCLLMNFAKPRLDFKRFVLD